MVIPMMFGCQAVFVRVFGQDAFRTAANLSHNRSEMHWGLTVNVNNLLSRKGDAECHTIAVPHPRGFCDPRCEASSGPKHRVPPSDDSNHL